METETSAENTVQEGEHAEIQREIPVTAPVEKETWGIRGHLVVLLLNVIITAGSIFALSSVFFPEDPRHGSEGLPAATAGAVHDGKAHG